ncbi:MAG TPA: VWA domain-containing protein [Bryobacteraceae bacterium]|jgi:Ca-activated chloride channel homolog|nr:VWA domain-containing protein [Bryobacteraceae bacterium]
MRRLSSFFVFLSSSVLFLAQTPPAAAQDDIPTFKTGTNQVVLHVTVTDKKGQLITNVPESAFHVFEDGQEQKLNIFRREDVPVSMGIIIDNSGSMREKRTKVAAAAMALVKASNPQDEVFIVNFNDDVYLDCPFTNDPKKMQEALDRIDAKGGTAMRDAISEAIDYLKQNAKKDKKVLLIVTDGNDNTSNESLEQLVRKARQSEVLIYSIGLLNEEEPREASKAKRALKALAEASGGNVYYPKELPEIDRVVPQIAHEIRNQYILGYLPTNTNMDGTFRKVSVLVKGFGNPQVRTRNGYYATPEPPAKSPTTPKAGATLVKQ